MSPSRQPRDDGSEPLVRGYAVTHPPGAVVLPVGPGWDQLLYAASGVMTVATRAGSWVVPAHRALWVPDGEAATVRTRGRVAVRTLYLASSLRTLPDTTVAFDVEPLVRELLLHIVQVCPLDLDRGVDAALVTVLLDRLRVVPAVGLQLPAPRDPRAADTAAALFDDPAQTLGEVTARVGASRRTLERAFRNETSMSLGAWHRRARLLRALEHLADGRSVTATAAAVGYSTPSAFVASFKQELGQTPKQYFAR